MANQISQREKQLIEFLEGQLLNTEAFLRKCADKRRRLQEELHGYHEDSNEYSEIRELLKENLTEKNSYFFRHLWLKIQINTLKSESGQRGIITPYNQHVLEMHAGHNEQDNN